MSGLSRTPGKRVWVNSPPRVRIPLAPPLINFKPASQPAKVMAFYYTFFIFNQAPSGAFLIFNQLLLSWAFLMTFLASTLLFAAAELMGF